LNSIVLIDGEDNEQIRKNFKSVVIFDTNYKQIDRIETEFGRSFFSIDTIGEEVLIYGGHDREIENVENKNKVLKIIIDIPTGSKYCRYL